MGDGLDDFESSANTFVGDLSTEDTLHAVLIRSPIARGRLSSISDARLPRGGRLIRAMDVPGENRLEAFGISIPLLAEAELSYLGEPIAILVGPTRAEVEEFARTCTIVTESEQPDLNPTQFSSLRLAAKRTATIGDPEDAFNRATTIVEGEYRTGMQDHWIAEPLGAFASFAYDKLLIRTPTQWPYHVRATVSAVLDVPPEDIVVEPTRMGIHLDGRLWFPSFIAALAALAAVTCRKPVRLLLSREEEFRFSPKRPATTFRQRVALDEAGHPIAMESRIIMDVGAGSPFAVETLDRLCLGSAGAYRCPNARVEGYAVKTNTPPTGPFAGFGLSQAFFAAENHVAKLAAAVGMDPIEWKEENALCRGDVLVTGTPLKEQVPARELIDAVVSMSDYRRKHAAYSLLAERRHSRFDGPLRGIGLSFTYQGNGFIGTGNDKGGYTVETTLDKSGILTIRTSAVPGSGETELLWKRIAAEALAIEEKDITIERGGTDRAPDSGPSTLSRNVTAVSQLIERCCQAIRKQRFRDPLPITVRRRYRSTKGLGWNGIPMEGNPFSLFSWAAAAVEVELDPGSYECRVKGVWLCIDGGRIHAEEKAKAAMETGAAAALAWAYRENLEMEGGVVPEGASRSYDLLLPRETPPVVVDFLWNATTAPKGIGELPWTCVPSAFTQAVSQAAGRPFDTLPVNTSMLREALEEEGL